eukprot:51673_1
MTMVRTKVATLAYRTRSMLMVCKDSTMQEFSMSTRRMACMCSQTLPYHTNELSSKERRSRLIFDKGNIMSGPRRWFSSSNDSKDNAREAQLEQSLGDKTSDLSTLSAEDMELATEAANEVERQGQEGGGLNIDSIPGTSKGSSRKLAIIYTCTVCNTRSAKKFTERAYHHGVVLVRCPNCESLHLISDQLGYFSDNEDGKGWDIETFMKEIGKEDNIKVATEGKEVLEVTMSDILGDKMDAITEEDDSSSHKNEKK